ncbi:MAG: hypothetical protein LBF50_00180 [Azoarcus sp.]|nr:hypothetical protein [Azoarcus sp.]
MSLTDAEKAQYVAAISAIWPSGISNNSIDNISDEVAGLMNQVLQAIKECSAAFAATNVVFSIFYGAFPPSSWSSILLAALQSGASVGAWIAALRGNITYNICVVTASTNWRTAVEMALMGVRK